MPARTVFRSWSAFVVCVSAAAATAIGTYAYVVDGMRHVWLPIACSLWVTYVVIAVRDQLVAMLDTLNIKTDAMAEDSVICKRRLVDAHERLDQLETLISEYGDRRQISGHLASLKTTVPGSRLVASGGSNVRALPDR